MTQEEIIRMALEAGLNHIANIKSGFVIAEIERFAALVAEATKEEIKNKAESFVVSNQRGLDTL